LRWTVDWDALLLKAGRYIDERLDEICAEKKKRFAVVRFHGAVLETTAKDISPPLESPTRTYENAVGWKAEDLGPPIPEEPLKNLSLGPAAQKLVRDVKFWYRHREWYRQRGLAWRRGYNLYGRPGTGKTSMVRALGEELDIPIHIFDLSSMSNYEFNQAWQNSQQTVPRIVLFEDFDTVFDGRTPRKKDSDLTFDCILNAIDGVERQDGLLLFVSTNHIECIDPALGVPDKDGTSTRPGRIDVVIELPGLDLEGRLKMARRIVCDDLVLAEKLAREASDDITAAKFQEACMVAALSLLWSDDGKAP
jgi:SpoVK/Ycf46/Vps4 family AAA+-type ATPase